MSALYHCGRHHVDALAVRAGSDAVAFACSSLTGDVWDGRLVVLDSVLAGTSATVAAEAETSSGVTDVAWLAHDVLATGDDEGDVTIWQLGERNGGQSGAPGGPVVTSASASPLLKPLFSLREHAQPVTAIAQSSADRTRLASSSLDGTAKVWTAVMGADKAQTLEHLPVHAWCDVHVHAVAWMGGGGAAAETLATGASDGVVRLWDVRASRPAASRCGPHSAPILSLACGASPESQLLAAAEDGSLLLLDARKLEAPVTRALPLQSGPSPPTRAHPPTSVPPGVGAACNSVPSGGGIVSLAVTGARDAGTAHSAGLLAVGDEEGSVAIVDPRDLHVLNVLRAVHAGSATALGWLSPADGREAGASAGCTLLSGGWDHRVVRHVIPA